MNILNITVDEDGRYSSQEETELLAELGDYNNIQEFIDFLEEPYESEIVPTVEEAIKQLGEKVYDDMEGHELTEEFMETDTWLESNVNVWGNGLEMEVFVEQQKALGLTCKFYIWSIEYDINCLIVAV